MKTYLLLLLCLFLTACDIVYISETNFTNTTTERLVSNVTNYIYINSTEYIYYNNTEIRFYNNTKYKSS
jgi:hypothetical protein